MSNWANAVAEMDSALFGEFSEPVVLHLDNGDVSVTGLFDNPANVSTVKGGGWIATSEPELYLRDKDAKGLKIRQKLTVAGHLWVVVKPPQPDGTGMTKLILGLHNGQQSSKPSISY
ncbi:head-tail joining protein [Vibrio cholerae]|uniref:head-tail joining protein n=1 Tax=Vibrio cholerae TaxID=666 RepID=UPI000E0BB516|nr:head-tail joining protein [Vibrio cholerae]